MICRATLFGAIPASAAAPPRDRLRATCPDPDRLHESPPLLGTAEHAQHQQDRLEALYSGYPLHDRFGRMLASAASSDDFSPLAECDGPYCAAVLNAETMTAYLVRDKFGLRPLFYTVSEHTLWFADDIRLLLQAVDHPPVRRQGIIEWIHYGAALQPLSLFEGIYTLPAGTCLRFNLKDTSLDTHSYFKPQQLVSAELHDELDRRPVESLERELEQQLDQAVAQACKGQDRVTILISGGVDSSLIAAMAARHTNVLGLTVDVVGPGSESEVEYAAAVARHLQIEHRVSRFGPEEFRATLPDAIDALGTPIIVENAVALFHAAQSGAIPPGELMLDGEGGDALFCGSPDLFKYSMMLITLASMTGIASDRWRSLFERLRRFLRKLGLNTRTSLDRAGLDAMLGARKVRIELLTDDLMSTFRHLPNQADREVSALMLREFYDYLVPLMLRIDAMAQAAHTHVVLPFLDSTLFRFCENIPVHHKIRWSWKHRRPVTKWISKRLAARLLPPHLMYRPKGGFAIPGTRWLRDTPDQLNPEFIAKMFQLPDELLCRWAAREVNNRDSLFLRSLDLWSRRFAHRTPDQYDPVPARESVAAPME